MFDCYLKMQRCQSVKKDGTETKIPRYKVIPSGVFQSLTINKKR